MDALLRYQLNMVVIWISCGHTSYQQVNQRQIKLAHFRI